MTTYRIFLRHFIELILIFLNVLKIHKYSYNQETPNCKQISDVLLWGPWDMLGLDIGPWNSNADEGWHLGAQLNVWVITKRRQLKECLYSWVKSDIRKQLWFLLNDYSPVFVVIKVSKVIWQLTIKILTKLSLVFTFLVPTHHPTLPMEFVLLLHFQVQLQSRKKRRLLVMSSLLDMDFFSWFYEA